MTSPAATVDTVPTTPVQDPCCRCHRRPVARDRSRSRCIECLDYANEYASRTKPPKEPVLCAHCGVNPARVKFCSNDCRDAARSAAEGVWVAKKPCKRTGCTKKARVKYCSAECRVADYNERRCQTPIQCGICGLPGHVRENCPHPAAVSLPELRTTDHARRCRGCGSIQHDARSCPKKAVA